MSEASVVECRVEGCSRPAHAKGCCKVHYDRLRWHGEVGSADIRIRYLSGTTCSVDGCERPVKGRGYCITHWKRWQKYQDPRADIPVRRYVHKDT